VDGTRRSAQESDPDIKELFGLLTDEDITQIVSRYAFQRRQKEHILTFSRFPRDEEGKRFWSRVSSDVIESVLSTVVNRPLASREMRSFSAMLKGIVESRDRERDAQNDQDFIRDLASAKTDSVKIVCLEEEEKRTQKRDHRERQLAAHARALASRPLASTFDAGGFGDGGDWGDDADVWGDDADVWGNEDGEGVSK
jgi:hypothetical protein